MAHDPKRYPNLKPYRRSVRYGTYDEWKLANPGGGVVENDLGMMEADWVDWPAGAADADDDPAGL